MKKTFSILALSLIFILLISFDMASPEPPSPPPTSDQDVYAQNPPVVKNVWVRKLASELPDGSNMVMKIEYEYLDDLPDEIELFPTEDLTYTFHDDGVYPDEAADDNIYSCYLVEDIEAFTDKIGDMISRLTTDGSFIKFTGHFGEVITDIPEFDVAGFNAHEDVLLDANLLYGLVDCSQLLRQNTLFITDLNVVEDEARTFNVFTHQGTPMGVWTFGNLMKNIANTSQYSTNIKDFLRSWLEHWTDQKTVNSQVVDPRTNIVKFLIGPWLTKCYPTIGTVNTSNWKTLWNSSSVSGDTLLKYAPFKLTAIVNRLDLRANLIYNSTTNDAGETRFIFTLIDPTTGDIPIHDDQPNSVLPMSMGDSYIDWEGMNIIFEYRNVQTTLCDLKDFAESWLNLSAYTTLSPSNPSDLYAFLNELETITHTVIDANSLPSAPNGSAIASIRTNEKIFQLSPALNGGQTGEDVHEGWRRADWQLKQFSVDPGTSHFLIQVPVTNTPKADANYVTFNPLLTQTAGTAGTDFAAVGGWVQNNTFMVGLGRHDIPSTYKGAVATLDAEFVQYFEIDWGTMSLATNTKREVRRQYSVNTCQGCHAGETKTAFTHVRPMGYGTSANYWRSPVVGTPDATIGNMDVLGSQVGGTQGTLHVENTWQTVTSSGSVDNYPKPSGQRYWQNVSAFLTGRVYGGNTGSGNYDDDEPADADDNNMNGVFWVNDPTNSQPSYGTNLSDMKRNGYNDLAMRKTQLCILINTVCNTNGGVVVPIFAGIMHSPFPIGAH